MLSTDAIFLLSIRLSSETGFARALSEQLRRLYASAPYQTWLGSLAEIEPFSLPASADATLLNKAHLVCSGHLLVKINQVGDSIFLTDGVWVDPQIRVFPFCDESAALTDFVRQQGFLGGVSCTLDLATGCGHNAMTLGRRNLAFDINPRALAYAAANRALNGISGQDCMLTLNDIRQGIPNSVVAGLDGRVVILANMPFGPAPSSDSLPLTSNGGESCIDLQIATYRAVADLARSTERRFAFRAYLMGLTVGDRAANRWEIVERAIEHFGAHCVRWHLLGNEHVFRIDGVRQLGNPAPVAIALPGLASCRLYTPDDSTRTAKIAAFADLARRHAERGNPDIAYGIVEIIGAA